MKADNSKTSHNRTILVTEIPDGELGELEIRVNYTGDGNAAKGIALDKFVIPAILNGLNLFSSDETKAITDALYEDISYYHETLAQEHSSLASALAAFDVTHSVTVLAKLDPVGLAEVRENVKSYLEDYLD